MKPWVIGTGNKHKFHELSGLVKHPSMQWRSLAAYPDAPDVVEDGGTFEANARKKAVELATALDAWVLADDSGIEVDALGGQPGIFSARYAGKHGDDAANNRKLLSDLEGLPEARRTARYRCVLALASPEGVRCVSQGVWEGFIASEPRGDNGFGYDPLFFLPEFGVTAAQLPPHIKQSVSHRAAAVHGIRAFLKKAFGSPSLTPR